MIRNSRALMTFSQWRQIVSKCCPESQQEEYPLEEATFILSSRRGHVSSCHPSFRGKPANIAEPIVWCPNFALEWITGKMKQTYADLQSKWTSERQNQKYSMMCWCHFVSVIVILMSTRRFPKLYFHENFETFQRSDCWLQLVKFPMFHILREGLHMQRGCLQKAVPWWMLSRE